MQNNILLIMNFICLNSDFDTFHRKGSDSKIPLMAKSDVHNQ